MATKQYGDKPKRTPKKMKKSAKKQKKKSLVDVAKEKGWYASKK